MAIEGPLRLITLPRFWVLAALLLLAAAAGLMSAGTGSASAHALLVRADPPVNAQLREPPKVLTLYFSEAVERRLSSARVVDANSNRLETGVDFDNNDDAVIRLPVKPLDPGYYSVFWQTVSKVDGHGVGGSYPLTILNPDGSIPPGAAAVAASGTVTGGGAKPERVVTKSYLLIAGSALAGALAFAFWVPGALSDDRKDGRRAILSRALVTAAGAAAVLALAGLVELLIQANDAGGLGEVGNVISHTVWGHRWLYRNLLLVPLGVSIGMAWLRRDLFEDARAGLAMGLLLVAAYLALVSSVSHAAAGEGSFWAAGSDFVHLVAASVWIGMLPQLALVFVWAWRNLPQNERPPLLAAALRRFSVVAVASVTLLLFTGTFNAVIEVQSLSDLVDTGYGRALLIKLLLLLPLLAAGGANAYLFRPRIVVEAEGRGGRRRRGGSDSWTSLEGRLEQRLFKTLGIEAALAVAVLVVVAVLVQLPPTSAGLSAPQQSSGQFVATKGADDISATLVIDPNQPGLNTFEVYLTGGVDAVERVRLDFESAKNAQFQSTLILDASNPPTFYAGRGPFLDQPGNWKVTVNLRRSRGSDLLLPFSVKLAPIGGVVTAERGGGAFALPRAFSLTSGLLLLGAVCVAGAVVVGSIRRPGLPAGYLGRAAIYVSQTNIRPAVSLGVLVIVGIGVAALIGTHAHQKQTQGQATRGNPVKSTPASIERGQMLFVQNCTQCHGESGRGDGILAKQLSIPPANLYDHVPYHPDQFFFGVITNGLGGVMPAFGSQIGEEDRWNILNFLRSQFGQPAAAR